MWCNTHRKRDMAMMVEYSIPMATSMMVMTRSDDHARNIFRNINHYTSPPPKQNKHNTYRSEHTTQNTRAILILLTLLCFGGGGKCMVMCSGDVWCVLCCDEVVLCAHMMKNWWSIAMSSLTTQWTMNEWLDPSIEIDLSYHHTHTMLMRRNVNANSDVWNGSTWDVCIVRERWWCSSKKKRRVSSECVCGVCMVSDTNPILIMLNVMSNMSSHADSPFTLILPLSSQQQKL
jgi:hypothetical protein